MPPIIPDLVPNHFPAGTTVKFTRSLDDFLPSDGWSYTIYLNGLTQKFNKAASAADNIFSIEFIPADTANLVPGPYRYTERLVNDGSVDASLTGETYDIPGDELVINIEPNVASSPAGTFNTFEEAQLAVIEMVLAGRFPQGIESYQVAGRSVTKIPIKELLCIRGLLRSAIWRQDNPGQLGVPFKVTFELENESQNYPPTWQDVTGLDRG